MHTKFYKKAFSRTLAVIVIVVIVVAIGGGVYYYLRPKSPTTNYVTFGVVLPLSGPLSFLGQSRLKGIELWVNYTNSHGGIYVPSIGKHYLVKLIVEDDASQPSNAASLTKLLITQDHVNEILGGELTPDTVAMAPIIEQYNMTLISDSGTDSLFTSGQYPYLFSMIPPSIEQMQPGGQLIATLVNKYGAKTMAILQSNAEAMLTLTAGTLHWVPSSLQITWYNYTEGTTDFSSILLKLQAQKPDIILISDEDPPAIVDLFRQMITMNITARAIISIDGWDSYTFYQALGNSIQNLIAIVDYATPAMPSSLHPNETFWQNLIVKDLGPQYLWNQFVYEGLLECFVIGYAISQTGQFSGPAFRQELLSMNLATPAGLWHPAPDGQNIARTPFVVQYQIVNGTMIPQIIEGPYQTAQLVYPFLGWA